MLSPGASPGLTHAVHPCAVPGRACARWRRRDERGGRELRGREGARRGRERAYRDSARGRLSPVRAAARGPAGS